MVLNPLRNRERALCFKCDHYICDECGVAMKVSGECLTFKEIVETVQEFAAGVAVPLQPLQELAPRGILMPSASPPTG